MTSTVSEYTTKELTMKTWPDFERLFLRPAGIVGDGWWCWCMHHHVSSYSLPENKQPRTGAERAEKNRLKKKALVEKGCAHGIFVYANGEPVGWCQYGLRAELPRVDYSRNYRALVHRNSGDGLWRITCFVVDKNYRRRGVARIALRAALDSIRKKGGGLVEAYPVAQTDQGPNYLYSGTLKMFEETGFKVVGPLGNGRTSTVIVQKNV